MSVFLAVSLGIIAAGAFAFIARFLKQPLIIGYLFAGLTLSVLGVFFKEHKDVMDAMSQFGITFLLFLVGLEMNLKDLPFLGKAALLAGLGQILFTSVFGYLFAILFGFTPISALYIAIALTFSSTIIVVKLLSEKKDLSSLYGKIAVGFLLVQDLVAILLLIFLSGFQTQTFSELTFFWVLVKGVIMLISVYLLSRLCLAKIFNMASVSSELLFIISLSWALLVSSVVSLPQVGFSVEVGGFLAGLGLASSSQHLQIASRIKPLRDFFITIFFLMLGAKLVIGITPDLLLPSLFFSLFVLIGNPLIVMAILGFLGYKKRTSFLASVTVAQISEFSFIVVAMGEKLGHVGGSVVGLVTIVGVITMTLSTYLILYSNSLYNKIKHMLDIFEKRKTRESAFGPNERFTNHIILLGCDRLGRRILPVLTKKGYRVVIVDFNPTVVEKLVADGFTAFFGDASDVETLSELNISEARMLVSTTGSQDDNLIVLEQLRKLDHKPLTIFSSDNAREALMLYEAGASFVIVPQIAGGDHLAHLLWVHGTSAQHFASLRNRHFDRLAKERF